MSKKTPGNLEYSLKILDGKTIRLVADWVDPMGSWRKLIPVSSQALENSSHDIIGREISELELRISRANQGAKVTRKELVLPTGWSTPKGPDWLIKQRSKKSLLDTLGEQEESKHEPSNPTLLG